MKTLSLRQSIFGIFWLSLGCLGAQPSGGIVISGSATIKTTADGMRVSQSSRTAVIEWPSFSLAPGERVRFVLPDTSSAVLVRVMGGHASVFEGELSSNGRVYFVNPNGLVVEKSGRVSAARFTGSTRGLSTADFLSAHFRYAGETEAGIQNFGEVRATGGDLILIGKTVANDGALTASHGALGLVAADEVGVTAADDANAFVTVPFAAKSGTTRTDVANAGTITAARVELFAADDHLGIWAVRNSGTIRARTITHEGGEILLGSDSGGVQNSGRLDASAATVGGSGGRVALETKGGIAHTGSILARSGRGGLTGRAEISGKTLASTGKVDLSSAGGVKGNFLVHAEDVTIQKAGATTMTETGGTFSGTSPNSILTVADLQNALATSNVVVTTGGSVGSQNGDLTVADAVTWSSDSNLVLNAYRNIQVNASISNTGGADVTLQADNSGTGVGTVAFSGTAEVSTAGAVTLYFNPSDNPVGSGVNPLSYVAPDLFDSQVTGGGTLTAYLLVNTVNDLQNINNNITANYALGKNIDATGTAAWNGGSGFSSLGQRKAFNGIFDGGGFVINGLTIKAPTGNDVGLFALTGPGATLVNVGLTGTLITGKDDVGSLVGSNRGLIINDTATGSVTGSASVGGLVGFSTGMITQCSTSGTVAGPGLSNGIGGLIGYSDAPGALVSNCHSSAAVSGAFAGGFSGNNGGTISRCYSTGPVGADLANNQESYLGGFSGYNSLEGTMINCYSTGNVIAGDNNHAIAGFVGWNGLNIIDCYSTGDVQAGNTCPDVGGFIGTNAGIVQSCSSSGSVKAGLHCFNVGGSIAFCGVDFQNGHVLFPTITDSYATGSVTVGDASAGVGGFAGSLNLNGGVTGCSATGNVKVGNKGTSVGGFAGQSAFTVTNCQSSGQVTAGSEGSQVAGFLGGNAGTVQNCLGTGGVTTGADSLAVGGLVGFNSTVSISGTVIRLGKAVISDSYTTSSVTVGDGSQGVGGFIAYNGTDGVVHDVYATGSITGGAACQYLGSLMGGEGHSGAVSHAYAIGQITAGSGSFYLGGFCGGDNGTIQTSFTTTTGIPVVGVAYSTAPDVTLATLSQLQSQETFPGSWDFTPETGVWALDPSVNQGLPIFQWQ